MDDILEMDIRMSQDEHLVLFHDEDLARTTNCQGKVVEKPLADLKQCDNAFWFSPSKDHSNTRDKSDYEDSISINKIFPLRNQGIQIPTLKEVFDFFPSKRMIIEIKPDNLLVISLFCNLIAQHKKQEQILVGSFHQEIVDAFRLQCPAVATSATPKESLQFFILSKLNLSELYTPQSSALQLPTILKLSRRTVLPDLTVVTPSLVSDAHERNLVVQVWTINDKQEMDYLTNIGIDGIMTDYPDQLLQVLKK